MTAYPTTCLVDHENGFRTVITIEEPSDYDTEMGAIARLRITVDDGKTLQVGLSPEAAEALELRLRELRDAPEVEAEHVAVSRGGSPVIRDLSESVTRAEKLSDSLRKLQYWALPVDCPDCQGRGSQPPHGPEDGPCETCGGWTDAKRFRDSRVRLEADRCGERISATHRCQLDYGHAGECWAP